MAGRVEDHTDVTRDQHDSRERDVAGVIAPPPLIVGGFLLLGGLAHYFAPVGVMQGSMNGVAGIILILLALPLAALAIRGMIRAQTHFDPYKPSTALLTDGVYRFTRNPMYVALLTLAAGIALMVNSAWMLAGLVPAAVVLRYGVIAREERYLERKFGEQYRHYLGRVRRWL